jgi:hypothetical protein
MFFNEKSAAFVNYRKLINTVRGKSILRRKKSRRTVGHEVFSVRTPRYRVEAVRSSVDSVESGNYG